VLAVRPFADPGIRGLSPGSIVGLHAAAVLRCRHDGEQRSDVQIALKGQPEGQVASDVIHVSAPLPFAIEIPRADEIGHNALRRPLGDVEQGRQITNADPRITSDQQKRVAVIRQ
jgi:hypothetical protein